MRDDAWKAVLVGAATGLSLSALGCQGVATVTPQGAEAPLPAVTAVDRGSIVVMAGGQAGSMGDVVGFSGNASSIEGTYDTHGATFRLDSEGPGWWAMSRLDLTGDLGGPAFAPGTHHAYTLGSSDDPADPTSVIVTGGAGPSSGDDRFDTMADHVELTVSESAVNSRHVEFTAHFGTQVVDGRFNFVPPTPLAP